MIDTLLKIENNLKMLLLSSPLKSMYIDYHHPYVKRIWFQYGEYRVYLHRIDPCGDSEPLFHPHPWQSAIRILYGTYEMGIGHSATDETPKVDCKLILPAGTFYEMIEENGWHYVNPQSPVFSIMVTGKLNERKMPLEPNQTFRKLMADEMKEIIRKFDNYYHLNLLDSEIKKIIQQSE